MNIMADDTLIATTPRAAPFRFRASDVTGTLDIDVSDLQGNVPAGAVARALAQRMELPTNVPWALRDERGAFLDEDRDIATQIEADARVTITPKTHLG